MLKTRTHKIAFMLLIGLLLLVVLAVAALFLVDPGVFRDQLEARASAALGRHFQTDGPIRLERSLRPRIVIEDITIGNPDWATGAHFATAEKISVQVALFPLLRGDLRILDVLFTGVNLSIEEGPDGANNYTFSDSGESKEPGVLPPIERLLIRNVTINYQTADAGISQYQIDEARLWNIPGEPERIEGKGSTKSMPFTILLVADTASELSGPQNPWSLKLDIKGPDMSLTLAGRMVEAFKWDRGDYRITIIGGPGQITGRRIDLWAADLIPTMLSTSWQRDDVTETNCMVAHIELKEGQAEIEDLLLDTQRITVAASGLLNLETEALDVTIAPRPKRPSLVSLANPVRIKGSLAEPEVSITRVSRGSRLAAGTGASLLAGLINPVFLIFAFSDTGSGQANPCDAAVEKARKVSGIDSQ